MVAPWKKNYDKPRQRIKNQRLCKGPSNQSYGFSSSRLRMWELDNKKGWALKKWCLQTVVLEKTLENPLDSKIKPVNPIGNQPWLFIGRIDAEAKAPIIRPLDVKNWLTGKDYDAGKDWRQEKRTTKDEMVGWHHWLNVHEFEQTPGGSGGQRSLTCCNPWCQNRVRHDWWLNNNNNNCFKPTWL